MSSVAQHRRNARLRKDYLFRKQLSTKQQVQYENKRRIKQALAGM
jgi:hypothetical protein